MRLDYVLFSYKGRINRRDFWIGYLCVIAASWVTLHLSEVFDFRVLTLSFLLSLTCAVATGALLVKRWHDRNKSGWWALLWLVPLLGPLWTLVETGFLPGTEGSNLYGEDPLAHHD